MMITLTPTTQDLITITIHLTRMRNKTVRAQESMMITILTLNHRERMRPMIRKRMSRR